jgi:hypothetical protein
MGYLRGIPNSHGGGRVWIGFRSKRATISGARTIDPTWFEVRAHLSGYLHWS